MTRLVAGRYLLLRELGAGRSADVHAATDLVLAREVAVKLARPGSGGELLKQARTTGRLDHPHLVRVLDAGSDDGRPFQVLDLVDGVTLADVVASGPLSLTDALAVVDGVLDGLGHAHERGVLHLDLSSSNVMLVVDRDGRPQPGSARVLDLGGTQVADGLVAVSPHYAAPEVATGRAADARSDLYSVGALLVELLTGLPPFADLAAADVLQAHVDRVVPSPSLTRPLPSTVDALVARALAKDPARRFPDARTMRTAVALAATTRTPVLPVVRGAAPQPSDVDDAAVQDHAGAAGVAASTGSSSSAGRVAGRTASGPGAGLVLGAVALVVGSVLVGSTLAGGGGPVPSVTHSPAQALAESPPAGTPDAAVHSLAPERAAATATQVAAPVAVPPLVGRTLDDARAVLTAEGLALGAVTEVDATVQAGLVVAARPGGGEVVAGSVVDVDVASGFTTLPDVTGLATGDADAAVRASGVAVALAQAPSAEVGVAIRTLPPAAARVPVGSTVQLVVGAAPSAIATPTATPSPSASATALAP